jgi:hypothetical protein
VPRDGWWSDFCVNWRIDLPLPRFRQLIDVAHRIQQMVSAVVRRRAKRRAATQALRAAV